MSKKVIIEKNCVRTGRALFSYFVSLSGQLAPEENCPPVRIGIWVKVRVSFRVGGKQTTAPEENFPPVRVRFWLRVSFGVGGLFPSGAVALDF